VGLTAGLRAISIRRAGHFGAEGLAAPKGVAVSEPTVNPLPNVEPLLLDARAVAELLRVSAKTVQRLAAAGELPLPIRLGRAVRWSRQALEDWIAERQKETSEVKK
jgi:excisionase family DNA binding protein